MQVLGSGDWIGLLELAYSSVQNEWSALPEFSNRMAPGTELCRGVQRCVSRTSTAGSDTAAVTTSQGSHNEFFTLTSTPVSDAFSRTYLEVRNWLLSWHLTWKFPWAMLWRRWNLDAQLLTWLVLRHAAWLLYYHGICKENSFREYLLPVEG